MIKKNFLIFLLLPIFFSGIFSLKYLIDLDSVYFFSDAYPDLLSKIKLWSSYNSPLGGYNAVLWLYPVNFLIALVGRFFNIDWNLLVKLFFYFPSLIISIYSIQKLVKSFNFGEKGKFLLTIIYLFNTYFILLVDGGQQGILLAYSIFPLAVDSVINMKFYRTTLILVLIAIFDPRFLILALVMGVLMTRLEYKKIATLFYVIIAVIFVNSFWILPVLMSGGISVNTFVSELKLTSLLNSLFLYQPHWPNNIFGKTTYPNLLFGVYPLFLLVSIFLQKSKEKAYWIMLFCFFAFLVKGETDPFGYFYSYFVNHFPLGSAFRDSTKFFTPLIIIYGLIVSRLYDVMKNKILLVLIPVSFLIPVFLGVLYGANHNLKGKIKPIDLFNLSDVIKSNEFTRTVYIPQKPQLVFQTEKNQAIDGRVFADYLPFASDNYGSEDRFNFIQRGTYVNYFRSLGIKNLVYLSKNEPVMINLKNIMPEKYFIDKLAVVVGSPVGVEKLVPDYGVLFLEDGKTILDNILKVSKDNIFFVLNNKNKEDLIKAFYINNYVDLSQISNNSWAKYENNEYLLWKYQLLVRGVDTKDINYDMGIVFSSVAGEKINYQITVPQQGEYVISLRGISGQDSKGISINDKVFRFKVGNNFNWVTEKIYLNSGINEIKIVNNGGLNVIGTMFIKENVRYYQDLAIIEKRIEDYKILNIESLLPKSKISTSPKIGWMIWNQSYDSRWRLVDNLPFAINSMTNGFYISQNSSNFDPYFLPQKHLELGVKISLASVLVLIVSYFGYAIYKKSF